MFNLNDNAVGRESGENAKAILQEFTQTEGLKMVHENTIAAAPAAAPAQPSVPASAGGGAPGMGGQSAAQKQKRAQQAAAQAEAVAAAPTSDNVMPTDTVDGIDADTVTVDQKTE